MTRKADPFARDDFTVPKSGVITHVTPPKSAPTKPSYLESESKRSQRETEQKKRQHMLQEKQEAERASIKAQKLLNEKRRRSKRKKFGGKKARAE
jgi:hypothetical protein